jgi:Ca2+-binding EF-hand superfamily protein
MFSPIGKKRTMLKNYRSALKSGRDIEVVARQNSSAGSCYSSLDDRSMSSMDFSEDGSHTSFSVSRQRKKRPKNKKFLNPSKLEAAKNGEKAAQLAMQKLTHAAVRFNKNRDGILLACFETRSLKYDELRIMLKKVFALDFSDAEYEQAFILFDTDRSGDVDGTEFLVYFTHLATIWKKKEKTNFLKKKADHAEKLQREAELTEKAKHSREELAVDYDFGDEDAQQAEAKLMAAAKHYVKGHPAAKNVDAFDVAYLNPFEFKNLCFQTFDLKLTPKEVAALVGIYDTDEKGLVNSPFFLVQFLKMGNTQRLVDRSSQIVLTRSAAQDIKSEAERKTLELDALLEKGIDTDFSPEDQENAVEKLRVAAAKFDKNHPSSLSLDGFNSTRTTPGIFREMLKRTFNIILPAKELGALVKFFDTDGTNTVNNSEFLTYFTRASTTGRFAMRSYMIARQRKMIQDAEDEQNKKLNAQWGKMEDKVKFEFTPEDQESAVQKLTELARKYFNDKVSNIGLKAFQIAVMGPAVWREMMKRSFGIKINHGELAYFISIFGNSHKEIDCIQFVLKFNALVFAERAKGRTHQLKLDSNRVVEERLKDTERLIAERKHNESMIDYQYSEEDTESAMRKLRGAALKHDKNHPAAVSLSAFEVASMPAAVFQELCRRVFRFELTGRELGSIVHMCGTAASASAAKRGKGERGKTGMPAGADSDMDSVASGLSSSTSPVRGKSSHSNSNRAASPDKVHMPAVPEQAVINCTEFMLMFSGLQRREKSSVRSKRAGLVHEIKRQRARAEERLVEKGRERAADMIKFSDADAGTLMKKLNQAAQTFSMDK